MKEVVIEQIVRLGKKFHLEGKKWHFHMLTPECQFNKKIKHAFVLENETDGKVYVTYSDKRHMKEGKELVKLVHGKRIIGSKSTGDVDARIYNIVNRCEELNVRGVSWHHHMLFPKCIFNKHKKWCIVFEDPETKKTIEFVSDKEPKEELRQIEVLYYGQSEYKDKILYLNSGTCAWGRCMFCGWGKKEYRIRSLRELKVWADRNILGADRIKIFCSGSFLDSKQISPAFRSYVVRKCEREGVKELIVESRENFVKNVLDMKSKTVRVTVAIGLEVGDDKVLKKLKKGKTVADYKKACTFLKENGFGVRSYILVNAPYTNKKILKKTYDLARKYSDSIVLLNCFPHGKAEIFKLWVNGKWRPLDKKEFSEWIKGMKAETVFDEFMFFPMFQHAEWIRGANIKSLKHPYFEVWQDYISRLYERPKTKDVVLFVPCAHRKPYARSKLHKAIMSVVDDRKLHLVVISSPGVIPVELSNRYPFDRYDWPEWKETPAVKKEYIKVTQKRIENYLRNHNYKKYFCYFKPTAESYVALEKACDKLGIKLINCIDEKVYGRIKNETNPLSLPEMLDVLREKLSGLQSLRKFS